jgi:nicotinamide mononucleotide transporter
MWVVGIISSLVYVYVFFVSKVYASMGLNIYNVLISVYGFRQWSLQRRRPDGGVVSGGTVLYRRIGLKTAAFVFPALAAIYALIYYVLNGYTDSPVAEADALVTSIGIVATWMLARRIIEHWIFWIVADALSVYMYYTLELYPTMLLYFCYTALAFAGYYMWKKKGIETDDNAL